MPIIIIGRVFRDPGVDFPDLLTIQENVTTAAFLGAEAHDGNASTVEFERRLCTGASCFLESEVLPPIEFAFSVLELAFERPGRLSDLDPFSWWIDVPLL